MSDWYRARYSTTGDVAHEIGGTQEKLAEAMSYIDEHDWFSDNDNIGVFWRWDGAIKHFLDNEDAWRIARRALDAANIAFNDKEE